MYMAILNGDKEIAAQRCKRSACETSDMPVERIFIFKDHGSREQTLNTAIETLGVEDDILFVGDDITFTPGWYEELMEYRDVSGILGMSMLYPDSRTIQDRGYRLVDIDGVAQLEAIDRGCELEDFEKERGVSGTHLCDSVCGCFLYVNKAVFKKVPCFREEGMNRWGEFIFTVEAAALGIQTRVINHYLYHGGHSTKSNADLILRSTSYQVEKPLWQGIVKKYVKRQQVTRRRDTVIDVDLVERIVNFKGKILIYGVGTVTTKLLNALGDQHGPVSLCSGLLEERSLRVEGLEVDFIDEVDLDQFGWVIITPLRRGEAIYSQWFKSRLSGANSVKFSIIEATSLNDTIVYKEKALAEYE